MTLTRWTTFCGILGTLILGCSSKTGEGSGIDITPTATGTGGTAGSTGQACQFNCDAGGTPSGGGFGNGAGGIPDSAICGSSAVKAEALPVDMYIMFDKSSSMGDPLPDGSGTWWSAAQAAVTSFVNSPSANGMGVGLQYFPLSANLPACTLKSSIGDCCSSSVYQNPEVPLNLLPANAAALTASMQNTQPTAFTPTSAALQGAIDYMKAWAPNHLGRAPVVVLVTDGFPTECNPTDPTIGVDPVDLAAQVKTAFTTEPKVRTFVVGFNLGPGGSNLNQVAAAGGSNKAFLIDGGNIGDAFTKAMLSIASTPLQCSFPLPKPPTGQTLDPTMVDVLYTPSATNVPQHVLKLGGLGDCDINNGQGWYYDSPNSPTKIMICPGTCALFAAGSVQTVAGCQPVPGLVK